MEVIFIDWGVLVETLQLMLAVLDDVEGNLTVSIDVDGSRHELVRLIIGGNRLTEAVEAFFLVNLFEEQDLRLVCDVEAVAARAEDDVLVLGEEQVENLSLWVIRVLDDLVLIELLLRGKITAGFVEDLEGQQKQAYVHD